MTTNKIFKIAQKFELILQAQSTFASWVDSLDLDPGDSENIKHQRYHLVPFGVLNSANRKATIGDYGQWISKYLYLMQFNLLDYAGKPIKDSAKIMAVQKALQQNKTLTPIAADGKWGFNSSQALMRFQKENDISETGVLDQYTARSLNIN